MIVAAPASRTQPPGVGSGRWGGSIFSRLLFTMAGATHACDVGPPWGYSRLPRDAQSLPPISRALPPARVGGGGWGGGASFQMLGAWQFPLTRLAAGAALCRLADFSPQAGRGGACGAGSMTHCRPM